ncbi:MAG TPA: ferredoxin [Povalibacter sp.]|uniref:ferredoxin n=1 Tax=Povalibacter sp. TaxID=1962978 RepID=UPI002C9E5F23|nr:ferredoxin [Povalibacter sp.]HMN45877.1 ferredoxin [Povalibacter sp.]
MKVRVDPQICAGFGVCLGLSPEVFELHEDGYAIVRVSEVPKELEDAVRTAVRQCPSGAISLGGDSP